MYVESEARPIRAQRRHGAKKWCAVSPLVAREWDGMSPDGSAQAPVSVPSSSAHSTA